MKFLIFGGIGYIGGRLCKYLKSMGHQVVIATRRLSAVPTWIVADRIIKVNLESKSFVLPVIKNIDVVIHLAAPDETVATRNPIEALRAGSELTWKILEAVSKGSHNLPDGSQVPSFIYLSTFHVYGKNTIGEIREDCVPLPVDAYALGKYFGECVVRSFRHRRKINTLSIRLSNAFGVAESIEIPRWTLVFNDLCRQAVTKKRLLLKTRGQQQRNFITLDDTVRAIEFLSLLRKQWPEDGIINLGSGIQMSIRQVAELVANRFKKLFSIKIPIIVPESSEGICSAGFNFNVDRLSSLGFSWNNQLEKEVDDTLLLLAETYLT